MAVSNHWFSEEETAQLLRRAAELQAKQVARAGTSEAELRAAAREIGIESEALDHAISELRLSPPTGASVTRPSHHTGQREREFPGSLSDEAWEDIVADLRRVFKTDGEVAVRGSAREWKTCGGGVDFVTVTVRQVGPNVRATINSKMSNLGVVYYTIASMPILLGLVPLLSSRSGQAIWASLAIVWTAVVLLVTRTLLISAYTARAQLLPTVLSGIESRLTTRGASCQGGLLASNDARASAETTDAEEMSQRIESRS